MEWFGGREYDPEVGGFVAHGYGRAVWYINGVFEQSDEGNHFMGKRHGRISRKYADGRTDVTDWEHGVLKQSAEPDNERFTIAGALTGVQNINDWLKSFRDLTAITADKITPEEKQQVGNLGWEIQNIGFYNYLKTVEGTLRKQNYDISKLEYELALERCTVGKVDQAEVAEKERKYQKAGSDMQDFLVKFHVAD